MSQGRRASGWRAPWRRGAVGIALIALVLAAAVAGPAAAAAEAASVQSSGHHTLAEPHPASQWIGLAPRARLGHAIDAAEPTGQPEPASGVPTERPAAEPQSASADGQEGVDARAPPVEGSA